ncbi:TonB family protein [Pseudoduganella lurida]|uniref:TonB family protein n=1 Tax=Pseudoduganella lurida TaxID=1036180 RepID=A0A562R2Y4_9BURK|nr:TonB family protein [Pseudoduganella lurida]TWI63428.1 TonB family protein [Pseudoduganella lurida]
MRNFQCHYETLKVTRDAPAEVIRAAYRSLSQKHHPDKNVGSGDAESVMARLNLAYSVLSDADRRELYDLQIQQGQGASTQYAGVHEARAAGHPARDAADERAASATGTVRARLRRYAAGRSGRIAAFSACLVAVLAVGICWSIWRENRQMLLLEQAALEASGNATTPGATSATTSTQQPRVASSGQPGQSGTASDRDALPAPDAAASRSVSATPSPSAPLPRGQDAASAAAKASDFERLTAMLKSMGLGLHKLDLPRQAANAAAPAAGAKQAAPQRTDVAASANGTPAAPVPNAATVTQTEAPHSQSVSERPPPPEPARNHAVIAGEAGRASVAPVLGRNTADAGPAGTLPANVPNAPNANAGLRQAVIADPRACTLPAYPKNAYKNGESGTVRLALLVGSDGRVMESKVQKSSGSSELNNAARKALSQCRFKVAGNDGAEPVWTTMEYVFTLD